MLPYLPTRCLRTDLVSRAISLRACYAVSGTDLAYALLPPYYAVRSTDIAISLRACCAMSGTDLAYRAIGLRPCYAMSNTDVAYGATRW
eukprot:138426-Rhodomonas_salina.1